MKNVRLLWVLAAVCHLSGQTSEWQVVQRIVPGTTISIRVAGRWGMRECDLLRVSDFDLDCDFHGGRSSRRVVFLRPEIRELRLERPDEHHAVAGALIGTAAGAVFGAIVAARSTDPETQHLIPFYSVLLGGAWGAAFGEATHRHGPVVYRKK